MNRPSTWEEWCLVREGEEELCAGVEMLLFPDSS